MVKNYQSKYKPSPFSLSELPNLSRSDIINEMERIAHNCASALDNPLTPKIVKEHIRGYLYTLFDFEITKYTAAIVPMFVVGCRVKNDKNLFIPNKDYIETLTGGDEKRAIKAAKKSDVSLFKSLSISEAQKIIDGLDELDFDELLQSIALIIYAVGNEPDLRDRKELIENIIRQILIKSSDFVEHYDNFENTIKRRLGIKVQKAK